MINNQEIGPMLFFDSLLEFSMKHINNLRDFSKKSADFPETIINQIKNFCGKMNFSVNNSQTIVLTNTFKTESNTSFFLSCLAFYTFLTN
jgi:hypothetical protein